MAKTVDDFSDGDLDEYFGSLDKWVNSGVLENVGKNNHRIISTEGLPNYPGAGDIYACEVGYFDGPGNPEILFGAVDTDNWFSLAIGSTADRIVIQKADGDGNKPSELAETSVSTKQDTWYDFRVEFSGDVTSNFVYESGTAVTTGDRGTNDYVFSSGDDFVTETDATGYVQVSGDSIDDAQTTSVVGELYDSPSATTALATVEATDENLSSGGIGFRNALKDTKTERMRNARIL